MDVFRRIARAEILERGGTGGPAVDLGPWVDAFRSVSSVAGKTVTVQGALGVAAVWAAVRVLSDTVGTLPLITYRRSGYSRERATNYRTYSLLHDEPNPDMSATTMKRLLMVHMNTWGNGYLGKTFRGGQVTELWPIAPQRVEVSRKGGQKIFQLKDENGVPIDRVYTSKEIIHVYGMTLDGLVGLSPVSFARESIGAALAMDEYQNSFFRAGALPRVVLLSKKVLSDEAKRKLRQQWERRYGGSRRANQVAVLEESMDVKPIALPQKDLEFVEQRKHSVQEIARWFRVPVALLEGDKGGSLTYSTVESENLSFSTHSVRPWTVAFEEELNRDPDLFPTGRFFCEFLIDELLRAETKTRYEGWQIALDPATGWMKRNEVRQRENLPDDPDFEGMTPQPGQLTVPAPQGEPVRNGR
jgi:HK97 family phage portal protein